MSKLDYYLNKPLDVFLSLTTNRFAIAGLINCYKSVKEEVITFKLISDKLTEKEFHILAVVNTKENTVKYVLNKGNFFDDEIDREKVELNKIPTLKQFIDDISDLCDSYHIEHDADDFCENKETVVTSDGDSKPKRRATPRASHKGRFDRVKENFNVI